MRSLAAWSVLFASMVQLVGGCAPAPRRMAALGETARAVDDAAIDADVAVVGGGIGGLLAARELERAGLSVILLEAEPRLGGRIRTVHYPGGAWGEAALHELWADNPAVGVARELGLELEAQAAFSSVMLDGELRPFLGETAEAYFAALFTPGEERARRGLLGRVETLAGALERDGKGDELAGPDPALRALVGMSFAGWLRSLGLPRRVREWALVSVECEAGARGEAIGAIQGILEMRVFLGNGQTAYRVVGGNERLVAALAAGLRGERRMGARVVAVRQVGGGARAVVGYRRAGTPGEVVVRRVVVAVPWTALAGIDFEPPLPAEARRAVATLGGGRYATVHFLVRPTPARVVGRAAAFPVLTRGPLGVIYGPGDGRRRDPDGRVFSLLLYGPGAEAADGLDDGALRARLERELDRIWPGFSSQVEAMHVYRYRPAAIALWPPGRSPLDEDARALGRPHGAVHLVGDWLSSSHADGAARSGLRAARAVARELRRERRWVAGRELPGESAGEEPREAVEGR